MMCRGLILTCHGVEAHRRRIEELSRLEHQLQKASDNLKQVVEANIAYEKKLCAQAAKLELGAARMTKLEKVEAERATENARLRRALEEAERKGASLEREVFFASREGGGRG